MFYKNKVKLTIPETHKYKCKNPNIHGEHYAYDGKVGNIIYPINDDAVYVTFNENYANYVGCPIGWLELVK